MNNPFAWSMVAMTIVLTSYGQLVIKWQANLFRPATEGLLSRLPGVLQLLLQPWMDRPAFRRHSDAIIDGNDRGVYGQQQAVHG